MNQKPLFLTVTLIALLVIGGAFWMMQKRQVALNQPVTPDPVVGTPVQTEPRTSVDTSDWKTYWNEEYGFEVKYPREWSVDAVRSDEHTLVFHTNFNESREAVSFKNNTDHHSSDQWFELNREKNKGVILNESITRVAGVDALRLETGEFAQTHIVFSNKEQLFIITTMGLIEKNGVLETFHFLR